MQHDARVFADRIQHDRLFEFRDHLAHDFDGLGLQSAANVAAGVSIWLGDILCSHVEVVLRISQAFLQTPPPSLLRFAMSRANDGNPSWAAAHLQADRGTRELMLSFRLERRWYCLVGLMRRMICFERIGAAGISEACN